MKHNGRKPVLRIHTKAGSPARRHRRPPGLAATGGRHRSVRPSRLSCAPVTSSAGTAASPAVRGRSRGRDIAEAALAGWLQSDGFVGQYDGNEPVSHDRGDDRDRGGATSGSTAALDRGVPRASIATSARSRRWTSRWTAGAPGSTGAVLGEFVDRWGLRTRGVDMTVPEHLFVAPLPVVAAYLRSIFQAEGYVSRRRALGAHRSRHDLRRHRPRSAGAAGAFRDLLAGSVQGRSAPGPARLLVARRSGPLGDRMTFADEIGFIDPAKATKLERELRSLPAWLPTSTKRLEIDRIEELGSDGCLRHPDRERRVPERQSAGPQLLHPRRRGHDGLDPQLVHARRGSSSRAGRAPASTSRASARRTNC